MVVSFRVFKKASPNNKVTIYLGRRDFIDHVTESDPIDGVLLIDKEYLQGRQVISILAGSGAPYGVRPARPRSYLDFEK